MPPRDAHRLFHAIVLMGVSLTGGVVASCGGAVATEASGDARADDHYEIIDAATMDDHRQLIDGSTMDVRYDVVAADAAASDGPDEAECYPCIAPAGWDT